LAVPMSSPTTRSLYSLAICGLRQLLRAVPGALAVVMPRMRTA
jgi:hypothetical protein